MCKAYSAILVITLFLFCGISADATVGCAPPEPCRIRIAPNWELSSDRPAVLDITLTDVRYTGPVKMNFLFFGKVKPLPGSERAEIFLTEGVDQELKLEWMLDRTGRCGAVIMVAADESPSAYTAARAEIYFDPAKKENAITYTPTPDFFKNHDLRMIDNVPTRIVPVDSKEANPEKLLDPVLIAGTIRYLNQDNFDSTYEVYADGKVKISNYQVLKEGQSKDPTGFRLAEYITYTDENGYYECPGWEWSNVAVSVFAENDVAEVRDSDFPMNIIEFPEQFVASSLVHPVTYCNLDILYSAPAHILRNAKKSWEFAYINLNVDMPKMTVFYHLGSGICRLLSGAIHIYQYTSGSSTTNVWQYWGRYVLGHEYGHAVMYKAYDDAMPSHQFDSDNHDYRTISDRGFAWIEGWAEFYGTAVFTTPDTNELTPGYEHVYGLLEHLGSQVTTQHPCPYYAGENCDHENGLDVEGAVATVLWDLYDARVIRDDSQGSDDDEVEGMIGELWDLVREARVVRYDDGHSYRVNNMYQILCVWKNVTEFTDEQNPYYIYVSHPVETGIMTLYKHALTGYGPVPETPSFIYSDRCGGEMGPQINIFWDNSGEDVSYYALNKNFVPIDTFHRTVGQTSLYGVDPDQTDLYSIEPLWGDSIGTSTEAIVGEVSGFAPNAPSQVTANQNSSSCCWNITWQDNSANEAAFWVHIWYYNGSGEYRQDWVMTGPNQTHASYYNDIEFIDLNIAVYAVDSNYCEQCYPPDHIYDCHFISAPSETLTIYNPLCFPITGCPFLYIYNGQEYDIENNLLAALRTAYSSTGNFDDYQRITLPLAPTDGVYSMKIMELADDITCYDQISMTYIDHEEGEEIMIDSAGDAYVVTGRNYPDRAVDHLGNDITQTIRDRDGNRCCYSGDGYIDLEFNTKASMPNDPIGDIPIKDWDDENPAEKNTDGSVNRLYVMQKKGGSFDTLGSVYGRRFLRDDFYIPSDLEAKGDSSISLRYAWNKSYVVDQIATVQADPLVQTPIPLIPARFTKNSRKNILRDLARDDGDTIVVSNRDTLLLQFEAPPLKKGTVREFIFHASGYYIHLGESDTTAKEIKIPTTWEYSFENNPNPFNYSTEFAFSIPVAGEVTIDIINILGRKVATAADEFFEEGQHRMVWDGIDTDGKAVASGVYFARFRHDDKRIIKKIVLLK